MNNYPYAYNLIIMSKTTEYLKTVNPQEVKEKIAELINSGITFNFTLYRSGVYMDGRFIGDHNRHELFEVNVF